MVPEEALGQRAIIDKSPYSFGGDFKSTEGIKMQHTQFSRVVAITKGQDWLTLRQIEGLCYARFGIRDSQPAISARLRDNFKMGLLDLKKETQINRVKNANVWRYRLVEA